MHSQSTVPRDGLIAEQSSVRPVHDPLPGRAADSAEVTLRLAQDRDRIASGMNDIVVHRLFSAGLCLQTAVQLMGNHPAAAKIQVVVGELDLAIRDLRSVLFDHYQAEPLPGGRPD